MAQTKGEGAAYGEGKAAAADRFHGFRKVRANRDVSASTHTYLYYNITHVRTYFYNSQFFVNFVFVFFDDRKADKATPEQSILCWGGGAKRCTLTMLLDLDIALL